MTRTSARTGVISALTLFVACLFAVSPAKAATVVGTTSLQQPASVYNLTELGVTDWGYWHFFSTATPAPGAPTNSKAGGTLIGPMSAVGGGNLRGSDSGTRPTASFSFTDGVSPVNGTVSNATGLFNTSLNTLGFGVAFDITLPTTDPYEVLIWSAGFQGQSQLTATIAGTSYISPGMPHDGGGTKQTYLHTLLVTPDTAGQVLTISNVLTGSDGQFSHALISGVAVTLVPEPRSPLLLMLAGAAMLAGRRRPGVPRW